MSLYLFFRQGFVYFVIQGVIKSKLLSIYRQIGATLWEGRKQVRVYGLFTIENRFQRMEWLVDRYKLFVSDFLR